MRVRTAALSGTLTLLMAIPLAAQEHDSHEAGMHAPAPTEGLRAELIQDTEQLEAKYMDLARAMTGQYDWRPAEGVRSVGEVFSHVASANFMIPAMAGAESREAPAAEGETGIMDALEHSFMHVRHAIADVPDAELDVGTEMFGQAVTKRQVLTLLVTHMHEHLGQAIAYARMNGVTPPWSAGQ